MARTDVHGALAISRNFNQLHLAPRAAAHCHRAPDGVLSFGDGPCRARQACRAAGSTAIRSGGPLKPGPDGDRMATAAAMRWPDNDDIFDKFLSKFWDLL